MWCRAFAQVNEGFHGAPGCATTTATTGSESEITFCFDAVQGPTTRQIPPRLKPLRNTSACLR
jgi:hypothetical protein